MTPTANKNRYHGLSHVQAIQFINLNFQTKTKQNKNKKKRLLGRTKRYHIDALWR